MDLLDYSPEAHKPDLNYAIKVGSDFEIEFKLSYNCFS
jgi:hypothetical protein